ncbi:hypothetical protein PUR71_00020, partial [Streptomyces sp. SP17BM10]|uniref:hypothetical protein n=1 Tax=Streptomyces sp. SP17BM10 TaxID=3002530 RepID=UPI002E77420D
EVNELVSVVFSGLSALVVEGVADEGQGQAGIRANPGTIRCRARCAGSRRGGCMAMRTGQVRAER